MLGQRRIVGFLILVGLIVTILPTEVLGASRENATPFPPLPEKFRSTNDYYQPANIERPGDQPVLIYTAWGSSVAEYLGKIGYDESEIYRIDLALFQGWGTSSPREYVPRLDDQVKRIHEEHGKEVDIIAHSLGGLTARWYVEENGGDQYVDDLITLAAPNQGSHVFYAFYMFPAGRAMVPYSDFLNQLNKSPLAPDVEYTAVWSDIDEVFLFNLFYSDGAQLPEDLIAAHGNARNLLGGSYEHIELAVSWDAFKHYQKYLD